MLRGIRKDDRDAVVAPELQQLTTTASAGRRQPPERSTTMAIYDDPGANGPSQPISEEEASEREQLGDAMQWLGLLHVDSDTMVRRVAERPLGQTLVDMGQMEQSAVRLERIARDLRSLRSRMRDVVSMHIDTHDAERMEREAKDGDPDVRRFR